MMHLGDISKIDGAELEPVDLVTGGSPCQDMSIAGKRGGMSKKCPKCDFTIVGNKDINECPDCGEELEYTRSGLFMEQIRIIKEMRKADEFRQLRMRGTVEHIRPRFMLWENVTGAFSSNKGEDFRAVLEETARICEKTATIPRPPKGKWHNEGCIVGDGWSIAWRVLDAQFWGVPQRRRRIALVADFGGECAGEILFKRNGLQRNFTESRNSWQGTAGSSTQGIGETGKSCIGFDGYNNALTYDISKTLTGQRVDVGNNPIVFEQINSTYDMTHVSDVIREYKGVSPTLQHRMGTGGNNVPLTMQVRCGDEKGGGKGALLQVDLSATLDTKNMQTLFQPIPIQDQAISNGKGHGLGIGKEDDPMYSLMAETNHGICVLEGNGSRPSHRGDGYKESDVMYTLNTIEQHAVAYAFEPGIAKREGSDNRFVEDFTPTLRANMGDNQVAVAYEEEKTYQKVTGPLMANSHPGSYTGQDAHNDMFVANEYIVRRLTPLECCRLQGFPDWWTDGVEIQNPNGHDIAFWRKVFETHRELVTGAKKPKTDAQIIKWLKEPDTDGAKYKMWGNGIALPCFLYVMEGIKEVLERTSNE